MKRIAYGTYRNNDYSSLKQCIKAAILSNYDFVDTAYYYQNEELIGQILEELKKEDEKLTIPVQTKIWPDQYLKVDEALKISLTKLRTTTIYSVLLHRPSLNFENDIKAWKQLIEAKKKNLVHHIGVSNYDRDMIEILFQNTGVYPEMNQIELSVNNYREDRVVYNSSKQIEIQAWSPMGDLENNLKNDALIDLSKKLNLPITTLLIAYLGNLNHTVVVKTANPERVEINKKAFNTYLDLETIRVLKSLNTYKIKASETFAYKLT